jgi:HEAT repeat protein
MVSLGRLHHKDAAPSLLRGLRDSNRLVRLRAAEALVDLNTDNVAIFEKAVASRDRYGLHAYLTALDNAGLQGRLEVELKESRHISTETQRTLLEVLRKGSLPLEPILLETAAAAVASQ